MIQNMTHPFPNKYRAMRENNYAQINSVLLPNLKVKLGSLISFRRPNHNKYHSQFEHLIVSSFKRGFFEILKS